MDWSKLCYFFATGLGIGTVTWGPVGTMASLLAMMIWWNFRYFFSYQLYFIFIIVAIVIGIFLCHKAIKVIGIHDHSSIVWDEMVGMWIALLIVPTNHWTLIISTFFLFRFFDIVKPYPISWFDQNIKGGFGVMIDDILAGMITNVIILFLVFLSKNEKIFGF